MTFFVDANVIVYSAVDSPYRDGCVGILEAVAEGEVDGRTSTAALEEVWYLEVAGRLGQLDGLTRHGYSLLAPLLAVTDEAFQAALDLDVRALGPNDRLHAGVCAVNGIEVIVSADAAFDGVDALCRIDPVDPDAVTMLRGA